MYYIHYCDMIECVHIHIYLHRDFISSSSNRRDTISLVFRASGLKSPPDMTIF